METKSFDAVLHRPQVNATFRLGAESYSVEAANGSSLSEQLVNMKEHSMSVLKDFITKHNVPQDVSGELLEDLVMTPYHNTVSFQPLVEETTISAGTLTFGDSVHKPPPEICIPFDLVKEILCRLPVKFLLQFRCVCKSWNFLISNDPKFAKKHLHMMSTTKHHYLLTTTWIIAKELEVMSYPFDSLQLDSIFTSNPTQLDYSPIIPTSNDGLVASCDGLLCFTINQRLAVLYNPCIRKIKKLPFIDLPRVQGSTVYAFGYDPFIDNYKVVAVFWYGSYHRAYKTQVEVHTLGTNSWRRIKDFPSNVRLERHGIFISGTVNWLTYCYLNGFNGLRSIVSLHLGKESYQEIPQPHYGNLNKLTLGVMRDCLCIFSRESHYSSTDVWLMKEYGNKESWIKLIHLPYFGDFGFAYTRIVYISEDDNRVLLVFREDRKLKWTVYDSKNDTIKNLKIQDLSWVESEVYVESLISP